MVLNARDLTSEWSYKGLWFPLRREEGGWTRQGMRPWDRIRIRAHYR